LEGPQERLHQLASLRRQEPGQLDQQLFQLGRAQGEDLGTAALSQGPLRKAGGESPAVTDKPITA
jgi:hypothetical protein